MSPDSHTATSPTSTIDLRTRGHLLPNVLLRHALILLILLVVTFSGCSGTRYLWSQADRHYTAVKIKDWNHAPGGSGRTIRILLVHGMNTHPFGTLQSGQPNLLGSDSYVDLQRKLERMVKSKQDLSAAFAAAEASNWAEFITNIAGLLHNRELSHADHQFRFIAGQDQKPIGYIFTRSFGRNENGVKIKFYIANWSLGSAVLKEPRFGKWSLLLQSPSQVHPDGAVKDFDPRLNAERALVNKIAKEQVMDWGLGDAALYLGDESAEFQKPVRAALETLIAESGADDRIAIITHSLGSTITLDTMAPMLSGTGFSSLTRPVEGTRATKPSGVAFYMFANQYGLLKLGAEQAFTRLDTALTAAHLGRHQGVAMQVYAFTDPDDLLSYPLNITQKRFISFCNVFVHNETVDLGLFREPAEVHVNYMTNHKILEAMLNSPANVITPKGR